MDIINKDLSTIKDKLTTQNVIIGNSSEVIKQIITMLNTLELKVGEIYDKFDEDVSNIKEDIILIKQDIISLKEVKI